MTDTDNGFREEMREALRKIDQRLDGIDQRLDLVTLTLGGMSSLLRKSGLDTSKVNAKIEEMSKE